MLLCEGCGVLYPIEADTPVLLRFRTPFHDWFAAAHTSDFVALGLLGPAK